MAAPSLNPDRWRRVRDVFERAVDLDPAARVRLLDADAADPALRAEVERLLAAEPRARDYLTPPSGATLADVVPSARAAFAPGAHLGPYQLVREVGRGGQGSVWQATDGRVGRTVALKLLPPGSVWSPSAVARFRREAEVTSRLQHPGICAIYDVDLAGGQPYVVMQFVDGSSLQSRIESSRGGRAALDQREAVRIVEEAARALHAAHGAMVVHRDVKPANLMISQEGRVLVLDFGIARTVEGDGANITRTGDVFGTPAYMAPEQVEGTAVDARTDVWGLGVTLFEALTHEQAFRGPGREAIYRAVLTEDPTRRAAAAPLPADLRVILATALAKEPAQRYASALAFADDLAAWRGGWPIAARSIGSFGRVWRWARREPGAAALTAGLALALLATAVIAGYLVARSGQLEAGAAALARKQREALVRDLSAGLIRGAAAERQMLDILDEDPRLTSVRATLALHLTREGRVDEALAVLDRAPADAEEPRAAARVRVLGLHAAGRTEASKQLAEELGTPRGALEAYLWSIVLGEIGGPDASARAYDAIRLSLHLMPGPNESYLQRLILCAAEVDAPYEERLRAAVALQQLYPESALSWFFVGLAYADHDHAKARAANRRAIELDVGLAQPYVAEHLFLMQEGDFDGARRVFESGIAHTPEMSPERQKLLLVRAEACLAAGLHAEALDAADRALAILPESVSALLKRAKAQRGLRLPGADATLERILELAPDHEEARRMLPAR